MVVPPSNVTVNTVSATTLNVSWQAGKECERSDNGMSSSLSEQSNFYEIEITSNPNAVEQFGCGLVQGCDFCNQDDLATIIRSSVQSPRFSTDNDCVQSANLPRKSDPRKIQTRRFPSNDTATLIGGLHEGVFHSVKVGCFLLFRLDCWCSYFTRQENK